MIRILLRRRSKVAASKTKWCICECSQLTSRLVNIKLKNLLQCNIKNKSLTSSLLFSKINQVSIIKSHSCHHCSTTHHSSQESPCSTNLNHQISLFLESIKFKINRTQMLFKTRKASSSHLTSSKWVKT